MFIWKQSITFVTFFTFVSIAHGQGSVFGGIPTKVKSMSNGSKFAKPEPVADDSTAEKQQQEQPSQASDEPNANAPTESTR